MGHRLNSLSVAQAAGATDFVLDEGIVQKRREFATISICYEFWLSV